MYKRPGRRFAGALAAFFNFPRDRLDGRRIYPLRFSGGAQIHKLSEQLILNYTELRNFRLQSFQRAAPWLRRGGVRRSFCPPRPFAARQLNVKCFGRGFTRR